MAFKVIIDGKPCSGKSTIAGEVEKLLTEKGKRMQTSTNGAYSECSGKLMMAR